MSTLLRPLRRSALEAFAACPLRFSALYLDGVVENQDASRRGSTFHRAAELYIRALSQTKQPSDVDLAREAVAAALAELPVPMPEWADVEQLWWRWVERFELNVDAFVAVEAKQIARLGLTWQPDLVYAEADILHLVDLKTHWSIWTQRQADESFQARFYLSQARRAWPGFTAYAITFEFVRYGASVDVILPMADLDAVDEQIDTLMSAIQRAERAQVFLPTPGAHCRNCVVACPAVDTALRTPVRATTADEARQLAADLLVLEPAIDARRKALAAWCSQSGPIEAGGVEWAHRRSDRKTFPVLDVVRAFKEGEESAVPLELSASALKPYLTAKKFIHLREPLEACAKVKPQTRFGVKYRVSEQADAPEQVEEAS